MMLPKIDIRDWPTEPCCVAGVVSACESCHYKDPPIRAHGIAVFVPVFEKRRKIFHVIPAMETSVVDGKCLSFLEKKVKDHV